MMEVWPGGVHAAEIKEITEKVGGVIVWGGATNIAPQIDKLIKAEYALSIDPYSRCWPPSWPRRAVGADAVVVVMPVGPGTKLPTAEDGRTLAKDLDLVISWELGEWAMTLEALPWQNIGPALEVREALTLLENKPGPNSLREKSLSLAGILLEMGGVAGRGEGYAAAEEILSSGKAHAKLMEIIAAQGGNPNVKSEDIVIGENCEEILAPAGGYVVAFYNKRLVELARMAGAPSDQKAGVIIHKKMGERVKKGEPLITICSSSDWELDSAVRDAKRSMPIVVEGMLLERYPRITEL